MISITSFHPHFKDEQTEAYRIELPFLGATASTWQRWYMHMCFSSTKLVTEWYTHTLWPQRAALAHPPMGGFKSLWNHGLQPWALDGTSSSGWVCMALKEICASCEAKVCLPVTSTCLSPRRSSYLQQTRFPVKAPTNNEKEEWKMLDNFQGKSEKILRLKNKQTRTCKSKEP